MKYKKYMSQIGFCFMVLSMFIFNGCGDTKENSSQNISTMPPLKVATYQVKSKDILVSIEYPAKIKSMQQVNVVARVNGILEKKNFIEGNFVKEGEVLYQIDATRYKALMQEAQADVEVKIATLKQATREWERAKTLFEQDSTSQKERDLALSAYETAQASLKASQANLKKAQIDFGYTKVKAPISGFTSLNKQDLGSYVGSTNESMILTTITQTNPIYVEFSLPDIEFLKKRFIMNNISQTKLPVSISFSDGSVYEEKGTLDFIDSFVDDETSTVKARATFENPRNELISGLFVKIKINGLVYKNAISIPQVSLLQDVTGPFVYVAKDNQAVKVPVKIGNIVKDTYIIDSGLNEGDMVITNNLTKIKSGSSINLMSKE
ncbi:efflux RND transporter periplasmic adaptor subunit [Malaciobacter mytili]|uniref:efflux RND transporter periplasmic adaptor subunit n=1 Tax=Malaciobacter mytili TaxID=603050 RepID=UPI001D181CAA|nr:efflux RND transporter periplasmic adaptor subunit [Malaciobacter mytili]